MGFFRKRIGFTLFVLALGTAILLWLTASQAQSAAQPRDYPSFTMEYNDWRLSNGTEKSPRATTVRLTYTDRLDWRSETVEDTFAPNSAGSYVQVSGNTFKSFDKRFNTFSEGQVDLSGGVNVPAEWLIPIRISKYKQIPGATIRPTDTPGLSEITFTEQIPCDPETWKCETNVYEVVTRVTYWDNSDLPMGMVVTSNGEISRVITVTDFKWLVAN